MGLGPDSYFVHWGTQRCSFGGGLPMYRPAMEANHLLYEMIPNPNEGHAVLEGKIPVHALPGTGPWPQHASNIEKRDAVFEFQFVKMMHLQD